MTDDVGPTARLPEFFAFPEARNHETLYLPGKDVYNPPLRGSALKFAASIVPRIPGLTGFLFKNAGWPSIAQIRALEHIDARYEPTVVPIAQPSAAENT